jgi:hypothetical protein
MKIKALIATLLIASSPFGMQQAAHADRVDQMISPSFHVVNFEDPRSISDLRFIYLYHEIDDQFVTQGGNAQLYALQVRYAIDDRWSIIATKDGYIDFNPKAGLNKNTGFADLEAGVKYVFFQDRDAGQVASFQLRYLIPTGEKEVLQGNGDGMVHPSVSAAYGLCNNTTITAGTGLRVPVNSDDSFFWDADVQVDYRIDTSYGAWYPLVGASLIHVVDGGKRLPIADEGQDLFNFGAADAGGESMVLGAAGLRYRPADAVDGGVTYQFPFDSQKGTRIIDSRWMFDVSYRF